MRGGILKVVAFPLLTKRKFTASSSESICKKRDGAGGAPVEMGSAVPGKVVGGTKCALASGCEDGDEMSGAKLPVQGNKAVRRE